MPSELALSEDRDQETPHLARLSQGPHKEPRPPTTTPPKPGLFLPPNQSPRSRVCPNSVACPRGPLSPH